MVVFPVLGGPMKINAVGLALSARSNVAHVERPASTAGQRCEKWTRTVARTAAIDGIAEVGTGASGDGVTTLMLLVDSLILFNFLLQ
jgi:hypothetical protein